MTILTAIIWCFSSLLEGVLLWRGWRARLFTHFPVFFGYIAFVFSQSILRFAVHHWDPDDYSWFYWGTEFLALIIGSCVVFEVYRRALAAFPGTANMAKNVLLFLFAMALARAINAFASDPGLVLDTTSLHIERALRTFQTIGIFALITLFLAYSIPFGRNLRGILLGYSIFVGQRVLCLTFVRDAGKDFWFYAYSASYITAVGIWLTHLWSPALLP